MPLASIKKAVVNLHPLLHIRLPMRHCVYERAVPSGVVPRRRLVATACQTKFLIYKSRRVCWGNLLQ